VDARKPHTICTSGIVDVRKLYTIYTSAFVDVRKLNTTCTCGFVVVRQLYTICTSYPSRGGSSAGGGVKVELSPTLSHT